MKLFNFFNDPLDVSHASSSEQALVILIKNLSQAGYKFKPVVYLDTSGTQNITLPLFVNVQKSIIRNIKIHYNKISKKFEAIEVNIPNNELSMTKKLCLVNESSVILAY